jgi:hypothetical protein
VPVYQCPVCFKNRNDAPPTQGFTIHKLQEVWESKSRHGIVITPEVIAETKRRIENNLPAPLLEFIWPRIEWELQAAEMRGYVAGYREAQQQAKFLIEGEDND